MTAEQLQDPHWLAANADHDRPFEVACAQAIEKLLTEKPDIEPATMRLKIQQLDPRAIMPRYATQGAACLDLHAIVDREFRAEAVPPGQARTFRTGLAFEVPAGHVMMIYSRSGHGFNHGVRLANGTGVIDADYRGEVMVRLRNDGDQPLLVEHGSRIAQAMILPIPRIEFELVDQLTPTERGAGGFGSTGVA